MPVKNKFGFGSIVIGLTKIAESIKSLSSLFSVSTPIAFLTDLSSNESLATTVLIPFDRLLLNKGSAYDVVNNIFTVPVDGVYTFTVNFSISPAVSGIGYGTYLLFNGTTIKAVDYHHANSTSPLDSSLSYTLPMFAGDTMEAFAVHNQGSDVDYIQNYTSFSGSKIDAIKGDTGSSGDLDDSYSIHNLSWALLLTERIVYGDTTDFNFTFTLPASPPDTKVYILTNIGANSLTIARNGNTINGLAEDKLIRSNDSYTFQFTTKGWRII